MNIYIYIYICIYDHQLKEATGYRNYRRPHQLPVPVSVGRHLLRDVSEPELGYRYR